MTRQLTGKPAGYRPRMIKRLTEASGYFLTRPNRPNVTPVRLVSERE